LTGFTLIGLLISHPWFLAQVPDERLLAHAPNVALGMPGKLRCHLDARAAEGAKDAAAGDLGLRG